MNIRTQWLPWVNWIGEHKDLRFVDDDINNVIIVDDYPPYIKQTQRHRLIQISQYVEPFTHALANLADNELSSTFVKLRDLYKANT